MKNKYHLINLFIILVMVVIMSVVFYFCIKNYYIEFMIVMLVVFILTWLYRNRNK